MKKASLPLPSGFFASGVSAGLKKNGKPDMALIFSKFPCAAAGMVTKNAVKGAPSRLTEEALKKGLPLRAVVVNTKYSNSLTGRRGRADTLAVAARAARLLHVSPKSVLSQSTGVIGVPMPMPKILRGVGKAVSALSREGGLSAARAILTTDLAVKASSCALVLDHKVVRVTGLAKGSGMIHPNMGTMLVYVMTDLRSPRAVLDRALREAVEPSFHSITVDGDTSTNDSVLLLANGAARNRPLRHGTPDYHRFVRVLKEVCLDLARAIVWDGEGATKFVTVRVRGARTDRDARRASMAVARSSLVKTALFGADPNWGRILAAVGYSGASVDEFRARVSAGGYPLYDGGSLRWSRARLKGIFSKRTVDIDIDLRLGRGSSTVYTCDLSHGYVDINGMYTT
jgi:glutamate N-acetyltransferase/amino-acid N-acetyltransferase